MLIARQTAGAVFFPSTLPLARFTPFPPDFIKKDGYFL